MRLLFRHYISSVYLRFTLYNNPKLLPTPSWANYLANVTGFICQLLLTEALQNLVLVGSYYCGH